MPRFPSQIACFVAALVLSVPVLAAPSSWLVAELFEASAPSSVPAFLYAARASKKTTSARLSIECVEYDTAAWSCSSLPHNRLPKGVTLPPLTLTPIKDGFRLQASLRIRPLGTPASVSRISADVSDVSAASVTEIQVHEQARFNLALKVSPIAP